MTGQTSLTSSGDGSRAPGAATLPTTQPPAPRELHAQPLSSGQLAEVLEADLVSGRYAPGAKLPSERQLAERHQVSRPIVREVLRRLQERGLIDVQPGRGSFARALRATDPTQSLDLIARGGQVTARQLMAARTMLECEAAALAARERTDADAERLTRVLVAFEAAGEDLEAAVALDVAFHEAVAVASANPVVQLMFGAIRGLTHAVVLRSLTDRRVRSAGMPLHGVVLDAIVARDQAAARDGMREHMVIAERHYGLDLDAPLRDVLIRRADAEPRVAELLRRASQEVAAGEAGLRPPG